MDLRTPLKSVRGLGSAKEGTDHWWAQRVTAIALVPLSLWFLYSLLAYMGAPHEDVVGFLSGPFPAVMIILMVAVVFYHLKLGIQVVVEDYISHEGLKIATLLLNTFFCYGVGAAAIFAVAKLSL